MERGEEEKGEGREQVTTSPRPSQGCHPRMRGFGDTRLVLHALLELGTLEIYTVLLQTTPPFHSPLPFHPS